MDQPTPHEDDKIIEELKKEVAEIKYDMEHIPDQPTTLKDGKRIEVFKMNVTEINYQLIEEFREVQAEIQAIQARIDIWLNIGLNCSRLPKLKKCNCQRE